MDINMPRDQDSGKPRGFAFLMYEDQRSTVLAVDNMNGALVLGRMLKVGLACIVYTTDVAVNITSGVHDGRAMLWIALIRIGRSCTQVRAAGEEGRRGEVPETRGADV
jgi:hypothetical protein